MKLDLHILIAVFAVLLILIVWIGLRLILNLRRSSRKRKIRRQEWIARINARKNDP